MPLGRRVRRPAQVLMREASREPGSIFARCPRAWDIFLTVGAGHAILAIAVGIAPGMLPHLRTSFSHGGGYDWASAHTFVIVWSLLALLYFHALRLLSGDTRLALLWTATGGGFLVATSTLTLTLPGVADLPVVSNLFFALAMTLFVQSLLETRWARRYHR